MQQTTEQQCDAQKRGRSFLAPGLSLSCGLCVEKLFMLPPSTNLPPESESSLPDTGVRSLVITSCFMNRPKRIYKYEPFSSQSLQNLKAQSIYFGSPLGFNDPYDCAITARVAVPSDKELQKLRDVYANRSDVPELTQKEFMSLDNEKFREIIIKNCKDLNKKYVERFLKKNGVSCFTERNDDLLMWSHYGGRYKGYCLEFNTGYEPFNLLKKINYSENMPEINPVELILKSNSEQTLKSYLTKSASWKYEKEWRCIHNNAGTLFPYEAKALNAVHFGPDMDNTSKEIICLILAGQNPDVELWQGIRSEDRFEVKFEQFQYMSHIDAVRNGQIT